MNVEITVTISVLSGAAGGGIIFYLLKTFLTEKIKNQIKYDYDFKLELAKNEIKHEYDLKFETARKELEKKATEHQIQYSKLHIDRSEKLKEIHEKLIDNENALEFLTNIGQGNNWDNDVKRENDAWKHYKDLCELIKKRRIYIPEDLCERLDAITIEFKNVIDEMSIAKLKSRTGDKIVGEETPLETWKKQRDKVNGEIVSTRRLIEKEFRRILGG